MLAPMRLLLLALFACALLTAGCARARPCASQSRAPTAPPTQAVAPRDAVLRDGTTGIEVGHLILDAVLAGNDVIAFGEYHDDPEGSRFESRIWERLTSPEFAGTRPATLAMEFFERDTQADLDAYLAGNLAEAEFVKRTRLGPGYPRAHRPLIEHAKAIHRPVIAANAPRRLVTAYRKQEAPYAEWKAALPEADRAALPQATTIIDDAYRARFMEMMGAERGARIFKAQSLWDDAMAEAVADRRTVHPDERVLLVVGGFHVQGRLGTVKKLLQRRPTERVGLIVMAYGEGPGLALPAEMRGQAGLVLLVAKPPEPPAAPKAPAPQPPVPTTVAVPKAATT